LLLHGCASAPSNNDPRKSADDIDVISKKVEQYGIATASAPILVRADGNGGQSPFAFSLSRGAEKYYDDARKDIQGISATTEAIAKRLEIQARYGTNPTQQDAYDRSLAQYDANAADRATRSAASLAIAKAEYDARMAQADLEEDKEKKVQAIAAATDRYSAALAAASSAAAAPPTSATSGAGPELPAANTARVALPAAAAPFSLTDLVSSADPVVSNRAALTTAAGDTTTEGIFRLLADPAKAAEFSGRTAFFGVTMISVTPGQRTRRKFAADISVTAKLEAREVGGADVANTLAHAGLTGEQLARLGCDAGALRCGDKRDEAPKTREVKSFLPSSAYETLREDQRLESDASSVSNLPPSRVVWNQLPTDLKAGEITVKTTDGKKSLEGKPSGMKCRFMESEASILCTSDPSADPTVAAVSPMTETQVLDIGNSYRKQSSIALDLAGALEGAGDKRSAQILAEYAKQLQNDAITRTPQNLVTGYSVGSLFGYQIGPSFTANGSLSSRKGKSDDILQRQSFPALLLFGIRNEYAEPRIALVKDGNDERLVVLRPYISLTQSWHWTPRRVLLAPWYRLTEGERFDWVSTLETASENAKGEKKTDEYLLSRSNSLLATVGATTTYLPLPTRPRLNARKEFQVNSVLPLSARIDTDAKGTALDTTTTFVLDGAGLKGRKISCTLTHSGKPGAAPSSVNAEASVRGDETARCPMILPKDAAGLAILHIQASPEKDSKQVDSTFSFPIEIKGAPAPKAKAPDDDTANKDMKQQVKVITKKGAETTESTVQMKDGLSVRDATALIEAATPKSAPACVAGTAMCCTDTCPPAAAAK
jgi:hypothetical protein